MSNFGMVLSFQFWERYKIAHSPKGWKCLAEESFDNQMPLRFLEVVNMWGDIGDWLKKRAKAGFI